RVLAGQTIYDAAGNAQVTSSWQANPRGTSERSIVLFDQSTNPAPNTWGDDLIAGGAGDDMIFGQMGNENIQGDGSVIDDNGQITIDVRALGHSVEDYAGPGTDGNDDIEGNAGSDTIYGGLGQDDIIGGSSDLFGY